MAKMIKIKVHIIPVIMMCLCGCFLAGCPSPADESKEAGEHVRQAIPMAEEAIVKVYPDAIVKKNTFYGVSAAQTGPDHVMTDWVKGTYLDGGEERVLVNVNTGQIYVTSEWHKIRSYEVDNISDLYHIDIPDFDVQILGCIEEPYCIDDPAKYGNIQICNMLPIGTVVDDDFARRLLDDDKYSFEIDLTVSGDVDMNVFEEVDCALLGKNVNLRVDKPLAVYESSGSVKNKEQEMTFIRDGKTIYGKLYTPKGDGPFPAVILGHQFGANHSTMEGYAKAFTQNGIMAYAFDFIGGGHDIKSDGVMEEMSVLTEAADMSAVLDGIRGLDNVDKNNIFLMGASQGGFVATYVAGTRPDDVRGLIAFYPAYVIQDDAKKRTDNGTNMKDSFMALGARLGRIYDEDALSFDIYDVMKEFDGSVLIVHGTADGLVPYEYSERAAETFADAELVGIDGADHGFGGADDERATGLAVDFVMSHSVVAD